MNGNEQQQNNGQPQEQQAAKPFPISDASTMDAFELGDWNIELDEETGRMKMESRERPVAPNVKGIVEQQDQLDPASQTVSQQNLGKTSPEAETRIAKLEGYVKQLTDIVTQMVASPGNSNNLNGQESNKEYDLSDGNGLASFIKDTVQASVQSSVKPIIDILPGIMSRIAHQDAQQKYGKDFEQTLPAIQELMDGGALTFDKVMNFVQKIKGQSNQSANTHGADQNELPKQSGTAEALISKANKLQTQTGINGSIASGKPQINNVRDALEAAIAEISGY